MPAMQEGQMPKHLVAFMVGMIAMVGAPMAAVPMPRTVLTTNVLPCVSLAKPADDPGKAF
jgi:hypothetical protein